MQWFAFRLRQELRLPTLIIGGLDVVVSLIFRLFAITLLEAERTWRANDRLLEDVVNDISTLRGKQPEHLMLIVWCCIDQTGSFLFTEKHILIAPLMGNRSMFPGEDANGEGM